MIKKIKRRRLNADLPEPLYLSLALVCEQLNVSKSEFISRAIIAAIQQYCEANPQIASQSLLDLLKKAQQHLLQGSSE